MIESEETMSDTQTREVPVSRAATTVTKLASGVTVVWGIPSGRQHSALGKVMSVRAGSVGKEKTYGDEVGDTAVVVYYDAGKTLTLEILAAATATAPVRGDVLTHNTSEKFLVEGCEQNWANEEVQKFTVTCRAWTNIALS
jgi:hypothetical protein